MFVIDVKVGAALKIEGVGTVMVRHKSGQQVRLVLDVDKQYQVALAQAECDQKNAQGERVATAR